MARVSTTSLITWGVALGVAVSAAAVGVKWRVDVLTRELRRIEERVAVDAADSRGAAEKCQQAIGDIARSGQAAAANATEAAVREGATLVVYTKVLQQLANGGELGLANARSYLEPMYWPRVGGALEADAGRLNDVLNEQARTLQSGLAKLENELRVNVKHAGVERRPIVPQRFDASFWDRVIPSVPIGSPSASDPLSSSPFRGVMRLIIALERHASMMLRAHVRQALELWVHSERHRIFMDALRESWRLDDAYVEARHNVRLLAIGNATGGEMVQKNVALPR